MFIIAVMHDFETAATKSHRKQQMAGISELGARNVNEKIPVRRPLSIRNRCRWTWRLQLALSQKAVGTKCPIDFRD